MKRTVRVETVPPMFHSPGLFTCCDHAFLVPSWPPYSCASELGTPSRSDARGPGCGGRGCNGRGTQRWVGGNNNACVRGWEGGIGAGWMRPRTTCWDQLMCGSGLCFLGFGAHVPAGRRLSSDLRATRTGPFPTTQPACMLCGHVRGAGCTAAVCPRRRGRPMMRRSRKLNVSA